LSRIELLEPMGARSLDAPLTIGGVGTGVVLPGVAEGVSLQVEFVANGWWVYAPTGRAAILNGQKLTGTSAAGGRELLAGDVIEIGSARIVVATAEPLQLDVRHLAGNETVAPLTINRSRVDADGEEDIDIVAATLESGARGTRSDSSPSASPAEPQLRRSHLWPAVTIAMVALLGLALWILSQVVRVPVDVDPREANVSVDGLASWHSSGTLFAMPGERTVRASLEGYEDIAKSLTIAAPAAGAAPARVSLQLVRKPGIVNIDTGGVAAEATVDGAPLGPVPGELKIPAGTRTLTLRAERYLDLVQTLEVQGGGARQDLKVVMQTSWGKLAVSATVAGATLSVDARAPVALPATLDLPAGVHRMKISAPAARDWESSVLVRVGQVQTVGPVTLGAPDARIAVRSQPAGADVTLAGEFRGRTPLQLTLPSGTSYDVLVTRAGYRTWTRTVDAVAGQASTLDARLEPVYVALTVRGDATDAEVFIDGTLRGRAPLTVNALAMRQRVEVRKSGMQTFVADVDLTPALARTIEFALVPEGRAADWRPPALSANAKVGIPLRLIPIGSFSMGSERREQGRRPNEVLRRVTFLRPFYLATREVTNGDFRRFRRDHASGVADGRTIDLDAQAVTGVTWHDAVEYCNWLSLQEGLGPAYEQQGGRWLLKAPVGTGYRLPSEAEWEYAARYAPGGVRRYGWGDALPVPPDFANLGGTEVRSALPGVLEGYTDSHPGVAPTGKYAASPLGLVDMTGNVSEWVHDWYVSSPDSAAATDPFGPASGARHVVKGSNWRTISFAELRLAWREGADGAMQDIGFRVARYAE
jgi:formylglycine-generating enzyme required for sulfatase activity